MHRPPRSLRLSIPKSSGGRLAGRGVLPAGVGTPPWALLCHCFTCGKDLKGYYHLVRTLAEKGWASLRFDFTGLGESGGEFEDTTLETNVDDVVAAATHLASTQAPPRLLIGHSLGGVAALLAAPRIAGLRGLVLLGTPSDLDHITEAVPAIREAAQGGRAVPTSIGGRLVKVGPGFLASTIRPDLREAMEALHLPVLVLHSPGDEVVPFRHAERMIRWAGSRGSLIPLEAAGHLLTTADQAATAGRAIVTWANGNLVPDRSPS